MPSYLVTGAARGLGFEFVRQFSEDPKNVVIGLVRDKGATQERIEKELPGRSNVHILQADVTDYEALKQSAIDTASITGGSLDVLVANAAYNGKASGFKSLAEIEPNVLDQELSNSFNVNVIGNVHLINLYAPLVLKGSVKKVVYISSGMADDALISKFDLAISAPYAMSKAAMNTAIAKFSAHYRSQGILFLSISPGVVDTGNYNDLTEEEAKGAQGMMQRFAEYAPHFKGPSTPEESVKAVMSVVNNASIEKGDAGAFLSHLGNKQWL